MSSLLALSVPDLTPYLPPMIFGSLAAIVLVGAAMAALAPRIVHAAFSLMACFSGVAGIYAMLGADFMALAQVIVYIGGILVLLVFGILLTGRLKGALGMEAASRAWPAILAGALLFLGLAVALEGSSFPGSTATPAPAEATTAALGRALLDPNEYLVPFELVSVLLLAALVGAAYLARRRRA